MRQITIRATHTDSGHMMRSIAIRSAGTQDDEAWNTVYNVLRSLDHPWCFDDGQPIINGNAQLMVR